MQTEEKEIATHVVERVKSTERTVWFHYRSKQWQRKTFVAKYKPFCSWLLVNEFILFSPNLPLASTWGAPIALYIPLLSCARTVPKHCVWSVVQSLAPSAVKD